MNNKSKEFIKKQFDELGSSLCEITKSENWKDRCDLGIQNLIKRILNQFQEGTIDGSEILDMLRIAYKQGYENGIKDFCGCIPLVMDSEKKFDYDEFQTVVSIFDKAKKSDYEKIRSFINKLSEEGVV
jgi:hypothetical protein